MRTNKYLLTYCTQNYYFLMAFHKKIRQKILKSLKSATIIQYTIKGRFMSR